MQPGWLLQQFSTCEAGVSSALDSELIQDNQLAWMRNGRIRGGKQHTRPFLRQRLVLPDGLVQGGSYFSVQGGMIIMQIAGRIYRLRIGTRDSDFSYEEIPLEYINSPVLPTAWMVQTVGSLVIQDGQSNAIIYDGSTARRSNTAENEVPLGRMMAYINGRLWVAVGSNELVAGDIVTSQFQSELKFTETGYFLGGGKFLFPSAITGLKGLPSSGAAGYGALAIFSLEQTYMARADIASRDLWAQMPGFIQALLLSTGSIGQYGIAEVNQDLYWRDGDGGIRSLRSSIADETGGPGISPISREVSRITDFESVRRLENCSAINFGNRLLMTASPFINKYGKTSFRDIIALDFSPISSMRGKSAPSYDGEWDGLLFDLLLTGKFNGTKRGFAVSTDYDGKNRLWEITDPESQEADTFYGCFGTSQLFESAVPMITEYPSRAWGTPADRKRLQRCDVYLSDIEGDCSLDVYYRPDNYQKWTKWGDTVEFCAKVTDAGGTTPHVWKNLLGQERPQVKTLTIDTDINNLTDYAKQVGFQFQIRTVLSGKAKIHQLNIYAQVINQSQFADREITDALCRENDVTGNEIEYLITPGCSFAMGTSVCDELTANFNPLFEGTWSTVTYPVGVDPSQIILTGGTGGDNLTVSVPDFGEYTFRLSSSERTMDYPWLFVECPPDKFFIDYSDASVLSYAIGVFYVEQGSGQAELLGGLPYEDAGQVVAIDDLINLIPSGISVSHIIVGVFQNEEDGLGLLGTTNTLTDVGSAMTIVTAPTDEYPYSGGGQINGTTVKAIDSAMINYSMIALSPALTKSDLDTNDSYYFTIKPVLSTEPISPDEIAGLTIWYDASQIVGKTDGQTVTSLTDLAGTVNLGSLTPSWDPIYKTNVQNGLPSVRFGSAGGRSILYNASPATIDALKTLFIVARVRTSTFSNSDGSAGGIMSRSGGTPINILGRLGLSRWNITSTTATEYRVNGVVDALGNASNLTTCIYQFSGLGAPGGSSQIFLGIGTSNGVNWLNFDMFEIAAYDGPISDEQRDGIMEYFADKWGITL